MTDVARPRRGGAAVAAPTALLAAMRPRQWTKNGLVFVALAFTLLTAVYTTTLKHMVLLDIFGIAGGFVLRAAAGATAIDVPISPWLYTATLLGALLIALGKRRAELQGLGTEAGLHRRILDAYSV